MDWKDYLAPNKGKILIFLFIVVILDVNISILNYLFLLGLLSGFLSVCTLLQTRKEVSRTVLS